MPTITYRETPLAYRRLVNMLFTLATLGAIVWSVYDVWQSSGADWDPIIAIILLTVWIGAHFLMRRASVTFDGKGLTYAIDGTRRRWAWFELSAPEIYGRGGQSDSYIRFRPKTLDWMDRLTWLSWRSRPEIRIPQKTYDAPLSEICARLNDCRDRALSDNSMTAYAETDDRGSTIVVYRERANTGRWKAILLIILISMPFVWHGVDSYRGSGAVPWGIWWYLPFLALIFLSFANQYRGEAGPSTLKLDDQGLTHAYGTEIVRCWTWAELSAPEMHGGGRDDAPYIRLRARNRIDWMARIFMPGISLNGSEIRVRPIFDAPLTNIHTTLNEYRALALAAGLGR